MLETEDYGSEDYRIERFIVKKIYWKLEKS